MQLPRAVAQCTAQTTCRPARNLSATISTPPRHRLGPWAPRRAALLLHRRPYCACTLCSPCPTRSTATLPTPWGGCHLPVLWPGPRAGNPGGTGGAGATAGPRAGPAPPAAAARGSGSGTGVTGAVEGPTGQVDGRVGEGNDGQREDTRTDGQKGEKDGGAGEGLESPGPFQGPIPRGPGCWPWGAGQALTSFRRSMSLR